MPHGEMGPKDPKESLIDGEQEMDQANVEHELADEGQGGLDHKRDEGTND